MIEEMRAKVWYSPTRRRSCFSKSAAISAEARAIILKRYSIDELYQDVSFWDDEEDRYEKMHRRMCRIISSKMADLSKNPN